MDALWEAPLITVPVDVSANAVGNLTNGVRVSSPDAPAISASFANAVSPVKLSFEPLDFRSYFADSGGALDAQAADHPNSLNTTFHFPTTHFVEIEGEHIWPGVEDAKDAVVDLPPGVIGDPLATPRCSLSEFSATKPNGETQCPVGSQVGTLSINTSKGINQNRTSFVGGDNPIFNLVPEHGYPAEFGLLDVGLDQPAFMYASVVHASNGYVVRVTARDIPRASTLAGASITFFGDPLREDGVSATGAALFTNPARCSSEALTTTISADSWENPGRLQPDGSPELSDPAWKQATSVMYPEVTGCNLLQFNPMIALAAETSQFDAPSGYEFDLRVPQTTSLAPQLATPELKDATLSLPAGVSVSPGAADGLQACTDAQIDLESTEPASCPPESQIGTVKVTTSLLEEPLEGQVFLGTPNCDPCSETDAEDGQMLRLFLQVRSERYGVVIKLPGTAEAGQGGKNGLQPGQLRATFLNNPQLPFSELRLKLKGGPRAPLANPQTCGTFTTTSDLVPWSSPETPDATPSNSFRIGGCVGDPFAPSFSAGTEQTLAGAYSPFTLTFSRKDGEQNLSGLTVSTPPGLLGKIAGVEQCPEPRASAGTCGPASLIGHDEVAAGAGSHPYWETGSVYLTGPYKGGPFGLSIVTPAKAGPFNLGNVVVRAAIHVNPSTDALTVISDPLPQIIDGVPLRIQTVNVTIDRAGFMFNPTNCDQQAIGATILSAQGANANVSSPFAVAGCAGLPFKPLLTASTSGKTSKADGASLSVDVTSAGIGQANIAKLELTIPKILPARLTTLQKACTERQFAVNPAGCPAASDIGTAAVHTPLLNSPLVGPAYFVSHGGAAVPDVEIVLQGEGVEIVLDGHTQIKNGITYSRFEAVPDAPFTTFEFTAPEGPYSIFTANGNLCAKSTTKIVKVKKRVLLRRHGKVVRRHGHAVHVTRKVRKKVTTPQSIVIPATIVGQNGAVIDQSTKVAVTGCAAHTKAAPKKKHKKKGGKHGKKSRKK
ncbi:MAG: hypothetical protein ACRDK7_09510 [Solirubrobacteraceae bacterium]